MGTCSRRYPALLAPHILRHEGAPWWTKGGRVKYFRRSIMHANGATAPLVRTPRSSEVDEHAAHQPRRHRQEMRPVLPVDVLDIDQAQIGFVDQFGRLHAVVRTLALQAPAGDAPQLVVDERHQRIQSRLVSLAPGSEENGQLVARAQDSCILTGFCIVSVSAVPFRLSAREAICRSGERT